jgi:KDO2-lipid IV(A) lauroyltransferase
MFSNQQFYEPEKFECAYPKLKETIPQSRLGYHSNNKYDGFPPLMMDGRTITASWQPEAILNEHLLKEPVAAGTGVIVALPHSGNWDHAGAYFCAQGIPLVTVAERLKPEKLFLKFLAYRQAIGMEVLALDSNTLPTLSNRLNEGKLIALVADRDFSKNGVEVDFFSKKTKMPIGPAVLSLRTGAPLITAQVSYNQKGIQIDFLGPLTPRIQGSIEERAKDLVQQCADNFEMGISKKPEDWHMLQRIWIEAEVSNG